MRYFPKTIAQGVAFCNREKERQQLRYNIKNLQHTLVVSPRRYGKTSVILKSIEETQLAFAHIDLFLAVDEKRIISRFLDGIANLVSQLTPINVKTIQKIKNFFRGFHLSLSVGSVSVGLKIEAVSSEQPSTLQQALQNLEALLSKQKKYAIIFIDEMQDIVNTPACTDIEAALRFCAQKTKHIAFIFSGSNRKLLQKIFDDKSRPLYKSCDRMNLKRISEMDYRVFLHNAGRRRWKRNILTPEILETIFTLTERHPYYVNYLCARLWQLDTINIDAIHETWKQMADEEMGNIATDMDSLSINQKKILSYVASLRYMSNPTAVQHLQTLKLTARGLLQSLKGLLERDLLEQTKEGIRVTDPLLRSVLAA